MKTPSPFVLLVLGLGLIGCGSSTPLAGDGGGSGGAATGGAVGTGTGGGGGAGTGGVGDAGSGGAGGAIPDGSVPHRPTAVACPATTQPAGIAGTGASCTTDSQCAGDAAVYPALHCLKSACSIDECLSDSDCPAGSACGCASQFGSGLVIHMNRCVPSSCHVDADCTSGLCSPANNDRCESLTGYHCRGPADECRVQADCAQPSGGTPGCVPGTSCDGGINAGISPAMTCQYAPEVAHWRCAPVMVCTG